MKKAIVLILAVLLSLPVLSVYGSEEDIIMMIVSCPEQNFSTVCRPECTYDYTPDGGLTICLGDTEDDGEVIIFKTDAPGSAFDADTYFNSTYLNLLESSYGSDLIDPGEYTIYSFADRELPGRMVMYRQNGTLRMRFCLYDLQDDYFVRYEAFSSFDEEHMQSAVDDMSAAIRYFQPDALYYYGGEPAPDEGKTPDTAPEPESSASQPDLSDIDETEAGPMYQDISYPEQGFATKCHAAATVEYRSYGATAFLPADDITIWVRICRLDYDSDFDAEVYFQEEVTPEMSSIYKDNAYGEGEFTSYTVYGKEMWGQEYMYTVRGNEYTRRIMVYQSADDIVRYEAAFTQDSYDRVMKELDLVVEYYKPDPYYYLGGEKQNEPAGQNTGIGHDQLVIETKDPDLQTIECPELGFSVQADPAYSWNYQENTGITIYTEAEGSIPYVIVFQSEDRLMDPLEYIKEQYTPHIQQQYGDDLIGYLEYEVYEIGGKELPAGLYIYNLQGHTIEMLRIMDSTGAHTVTYTAKYEQGNSEATLAALDTAVRTFEGN